MLPGVAVALFGYVLRQLRLRAGLTQEQLALAAGLSTRTISDLERGINLTPRHATAQLLIDALGLAEADRAMFEAARRRTLQAGNAVGVPASWLVTAPDYSAPEESVDELDVTVNGTPHPGAGAPRAPARWEALSLPPRLSILAGREDVLADMDARLADGDGEPRRIVLCGLGGVGKTSLAVEYAHMHLAEVGVAWQVHSENTVVMTAGLGMLAAQLGAIQQPGQQDPVASTHAALADHAFEWILIFDNAQDEASVRRFIPPAGNGTVIVTSQSQHWPDWDLIDVRALDAEVSAQFLSGRTEDPHHAEALELAVELGGLPLALDQAAAYTKATGLSLASYLRLYRQRQTDLLRRGEVAGHPASVVATIALALSKLEDQVPTSGLLCLLACLAPEPIPLEILLSYPEPASPNPDVASALDSLIGDPLAVSDAVAALRRYSLVNVVGDGMVQMHRLVKAITLDLTPPSTRTAWRSAAAVLIEAAIPYDTSSPSSWPACAALLPHAQAVLDPGSGGLLRISIYIGNSGSYSIARDLAREVAEARMSAELYGREHPDALAVLYDVARWTGRAGDPARARDLLADLLPIRERVLGAEHLDTLATIGNLARWAGEAGDHARARDLFADLLPLQERVLGPQHPLTLSSRASVARWTGETGDPMRAANLFADLLPVDEQVLGVEHPHTLTCRAMAARWTGESGDPVRARDLLADLLPVQERILGAEHPHTLITRASLAYWVGEAGDPGRARDLLADLLPVRERVLGPSHPDTLATWHDLARFTVDSGDPTSARSLLSGLLPLQERVLGPEHPDTRSTANMIRRIDAG